MAETIKIEIPIEAVDKTEAGIQSATRNLTAFERSMTRTQNQLDRMNRSGVRIAITADDNASPVLDGVGDSASRVNGMSSNVTVGAEDNATQVIRGAGDSVESFDGQSGSADIGAADNATPVIRAAADQVESFSGSSGSAEIGANDNATPVIRAVQDAAEALGGMSVSIDVGVNDSASQAIAAIRDQIAELERDTQNLPGRSSGKNGGSSSLPSFGIGGLLTAAGTSLGVGAATGSAVNTFKDFESMMSQVQAISGATGSGLEVLTAKAKEMGATTKFTATEAAEAMNFMAMAGWKTDDMLGGISGIMNLAAASGESLGTTSDIVTDALTAFGLKASDSTHFADVLAQASSNANTNVSF